MQPCARNHLSGTTRRMAGKVVPLTKLERARQWSVALLRDVADRLDAAPRSQAADALLYLSATLTTLERQAGVVLPAKK